INRTDVVRRVVGVSGTVQFEVDVRIRFDYARALPWVQQLDSDDGPQLVAMAGPDAVVMRGVRLHAGGERQRAEFAVGAEEEVELTLTWFASHRAVPGRLDVNLALQQTHAWWQSWADRVEHGGVHGSEVVRSLLVLRALTNHDTGGIAAAATTSLPEDFG